jgi:FLVCR family feline leukemia virus subgroup C receptor-related protein
MIVSKTKQYKIANIIICIGSILSGAAFLFVLEQEIAVLCYVAAGFLGFFVVASLSVGLDFGCEVSYPVPANNVTGVMLSYSMIISSIHILAANFIFTEKKDKETDRGPKNEARMMVGILILTIVIALFFALFPKEDLRRNAIDKNNESPTQRLSETEDE